MQRDLLVSFAKLATTIDYNIISKYIRCADWSTDNTTRSCPLLCTTLIRQSQFVIFADARPTHSSGQARIPWVSSTTTSAIAAAPR